jgi:hypothetical protein
MKDTTVSELLFECPSIFHRRVFFTTLESPTMNDRDVRNRKHQFLIEGGVKALYLLGSAPAFSKGVTSNLGGVAAPEIQSQGSLFGYDKIAIPKSDELGNTLGL